MTGMKVNISLSKFTDLWLRILRWTANTAIYISVGRMMRHRARATKCCTTPTWKVIITINKLVFATTFPFYQWWLGHNNRVFFSCVFKTWNVHFLRMSRNSIFFSHFSWWIKMVRELILHFIPFMSCII